MNYVRSADIIKMSKIKEKTITLIFKLVFLYRQIYGSKFIYYNKL